MMGDPGDEAELIVAAAEAVTAAEVACMKHEIAVGLEVAALELREFNGALSNLADKFRAMIGPLTVLVEQVQAEEAEHVAAWDDEIGF